MQQRAPKSTCKMPLDVGGGPVNAFDLDHIEVDPNLRMVRENLSWSNPYIHNSLDTSWISSPHSHLNKLENPIHLFKTKIQSSPHCFSGHVWSEWAYKLISHMHILLHNPIISSNGIFMDYNIYVSTAGACCKSGHLVKWHQLRSYGVKSYEKAFKLSTNYLWHLDLDRIMKKLVDDDLQLMIFKFGCTKYSIILYGYKNNGVS